MNVTGHYVVEHVLPAMCELLPGQMRGRPGLAMLVAIGLQESDGFRARRQYAGGPARGFWQFEINGVRAVLRHHASAVAAANLLAVLGYRDHAPNVVHDALEHNDVLAAGFARLLLYTDARLPPQSADGEADGWQQYIACWRPGKPHPDKWAGNFSEAWSIDYAQGRDGIAGRVVGMGKG